MRLSSSLSLSISAPLRPMTMPGRAVMIVMRQRLAARSIRICGTEADSSFFLSSSRMLRSSVSSLPNSFLPAYHLERQSRLTAMRKPTGFVFWPIDQNSRDEATVEGSEGLFIREHDFDVAVALENRAGGAPGLGREPPQGGGGLSDGFLDAQLVDGQAAVLFLVFF